MAKKHKIKAINEKSELLKYGHPLTCTCSTSTITKGNIYRVRGHFYYLNRYEGYNQWDEFVTIKNDYGYTIKVNLLKFDRNTILPPTPKRLEQRIKELESEIEILKLNQKQ